MAVISSWQVLVVTGVLVIYILLVNYVARVYHPRSGMTLIPRIKIKRKPKADVASHDSAEESEELAFEEDIEVK